jgi:hypothetical protein
VRCQFLPELGVSNRASRILDSAEIGNFPVFERACRSIGLLAAAEASAPNPALRGEMFAALWCEQDGVTCGRTCRCAEFGLQMMQTRYRTKP